MASATAGWVPSQITGLSVQAGTSLVCSVSSSISLTQICHNLYNGVVVDLEYLGFHPATGEQHDHCVVASLWSWSSLRAIALSTDAFPRECHDTLVVDAALSLSFIGANLVNAMYLIRSND